MPFGNYLCYPLGNTTSAMLTIAETRRARLEILIERFKGRIADLNEALGYERNDTRLARVRNANVRKDRPGNKVFQMGDAQAREIEQRLDLERGWMDTPPGFEYASSERMEQLHKVAQTLQPYQIDQWIAMATVLANAPRPELAVASDPHETSSHGSEGSAKLSAVKPGNPQKIGAGHFGPPATGDAVRGSKNGSSSQHGTGVRKGNARGRR
jgi:hypothetical protein